MKIRLLSLLPVLCLTLQLHAQGLVMDPSPASEITVSGVADVYELVAHASVTNTTNQTLTVTWQRTSNDLFGAGWRSLVCDKITCWSPNVNNNTITIPPGESSILDVHFQSNEATIGPGYGIVQIAITVAENSAYNLNATYRCDAWAVGIQTPYQEEIKFYPNPVRDRLNIEFNSYTNVKYLEVYNIIGAKIAQFSVYNSYYPFVYDATALDEGMYFIRLYDHDYNFIESKVFTKSR
ncbi:T9SS C-terminal target domain-containing protein [Sphingobacteriales bacterium UPWRP_1]|nr:hypothetical protein BVG80_10645 [Sphingobacteriales bacterium TSM_CSM]PSJ78874.1 T9SS C-terminal target domain-containing protein [Sphingobacteriales bacterium UPWRP_1]